MGSRDGSDPRDQFSSFSIDLRMHTLWVNNRNGNEFHSPCQFCATGIDCLQTMLKKILRSHPRDRDVTVTVMHVLGKAMGSPGK